ncbi:Sbal_3080 family lipoprotein [Endozoicomonas atrinae]|uniref:Sbal_3080 family lipoprotein n=1 Tax=Endozoicomonas atrinae TaxID=1333660 RepID=UPI000826B4D8|nr:Sbal_3080 family lipoprotein [Endozoicomonas atrinae]
MKPNNKTTQKILAISAFMVLAGCTSVKVQPVSSSENIDTICIENNPKVVREDFLPAVRSEIQKYGINTVLYDSATMPASCNYRMTYTALQSWDFKPFLSHAELHLYKGYAKIGEGIFHLKGKGGLDLSKFDSTQDKMAPVIQQMFGSLGK